MMYNTTDVSRITGIDLTTIRTILGLPEFEKKRQEKRKRRGFFYSFDKTDIENIKNIVNSRRKWKRLKERGD